MTADREQHIRAAFAGADSHGARVAMAEVMIGLLREMAAVRGEVSALAARVPSEEHARIIDEAVELGVSIAKITGWMHRRANNFRALVLWVTPLLVLYVTLRSAGFDVFSAAKGWIGGNRP